MLTFLQTSLTRHLPTSTSTASPQNAFLKLKIDLKGETMSIKGIRLIILFKEPLLGQAVGLRQLDKHILKIDLREPH